MAIRDEGRITKNDFHPTLKTEYTNIQTKALNAENTIGTGTLQTSNKTLIPAINELFQSGVEITNIAKTALDAAGIGYSNTQLRTLVNTMGSNLYTQNMKDRLQQAIQNAGGSADKNNFDSIVNGIGNLGGNGLTKEELLHTNKNGESLKYFSISFKTSGTMSGTSIINNIDRYFSSYTIKIFNGTKEITLEEFKNNNRVDSLFDGFRIIIDLGNSSNKIISAHVNLTGGTDTNVHSYKNVYGKELDTTINGLKFYNNIFDNYNDVLTPSLDTYSDDFLNFNNFGVRHNQFMLAYKGNNSSARTTSYAIYYE